jgi:16S rRNA (guanine527-N7)-methyltransferase
MSSTGLDLLKKYFADFTPEQETQFEKLGGLYRDWNDKINVISRKDIDSLYEKHILHSLAIAAIFNFADAPGLQVVDIGTGGGFPGIPLAIMFPEVRFTLVDSIGKKLKVIEAVKEGAGITNVRTIHSRAEELAPNTYDFVVSRAVAPLKDLWIWGKPLLRGGRKLEEFKNGMIFLKGGDLSQEISDSKLRPHMWEISTIFSETWFQEKYILYVPL